jgi:autotransporter-associated beta strand protein
MGGTSMDADAFRVSDLVNDSDPEMASAFLTTTEYGPGAAGHYGWPNSEWQNGNNVVRWITPHVNYYGGNEPLNDPLNNEPVSDYFEFTFTGTGVRIPLGSAFSYAYFYMKVDGVYHSNVAVSDRQISYFDVQGLPPGNHTVRGITWKSTFDPSQPGFNGFTVTRPDLWNTASGRGFGEIGDDVHYTDINPARLVWNFNGSGVDVITTRDSDARMAWFSVAGMGRHVGARRNNYSAARQTGTSVFSMPNLTPGSHSVYVEHGANTSGANFSFARLAIDALRVYKGESLSAAPLLWGATGNGGSGTWDVGSTANWNDGGSSTAWHDFGGTDYSAVFTGTPGTVNLASSINANRITFKTSGYTLQGNSLTLNGSAPTLATDANATIASALIGSSGLTKAGTATLSVTGPNNYTGATTIAAGRLALNGPYATPGFAIAPGAVLDINAATYLDLPAVTVSGAGTLRKSGSADLVWGPTSAIFALGSGSLIDVQAGTFIGGSYANENWASNLSDLNVASGAVFKGVEANVRVNRLTGSGTIGTGYGGAGYQNLSIGVDNGTATFTGSITNTDNNPSWPGNLVKLGSGTETLAGSNTYTGTTTVSEGKLIITGSLNHTSSVTIATGGTLEISGSLAATGNIINNGTLILTGAPQLSAGGTITNNGTIINLAPGFALPPNLVNNGSILSGPGMSLDYATWASNAGVSGAPDADDDGDGLNNRSEYAFALNPKSGSSANPITIPFKPADGTFTYTRRDPALGTNLAYTIWTSPDLASWTQDASATQTVTSTQADAQSVKVTVSPGRLSNAKLFVQVRATTP